MEVTCLEKAREVLLANKENYLANALLAKELQSNSFDSDKAFTLGLGYLRDKNFESARTCFRELSKIRGDFESHFYFAKASEDLGETDLARQIYFDAFLIPSENITLQFEAYKNVGNIYLREKNLDLAEDFYHKAFALIPESPQLLVNLGTLEMQKGQTGVAIDKYRRALQFNLKFAPAWVGLALCYHEFGDFEMAWASLLKAIEYDPENSTALLLLAQWSLKNESTELALQQLMNYFDRGVFDAQLSLAFVELAIRANNFIMARIELERALLWEPLNQDLLSFDRALQNHGY